MKAVAGLTVNGVGFPHLNDPHPQRQQAEPEYPTLPHVDIALSHYVVNQRRNKHPNRAGWLPAALLVHLSAVEVDPGGYDVKGCDACHPGEWQSASDRYCDGMRWSVRLVHRGIRGFHPGLEHCQLDR